MKAEELMIGDWVYLVPSHKPTRWAVDDFGYSPEFIDYNFSPIPITQDILMGNGFTLAKRGKTWHFSEGDTLISWSEWGRMVISSKGASHGNRLNCDCRYVHELQHALRICGIEKEIIP